MGGGLGKRVTFPFKLWRLDYKTFKTVAVIICSDFFHHDGNLILQSRSDKSFELQNDLLKISFSNKTKIKMTYHGPESQLLKLQSFGLTAFAPSLNAGEVCISQV